MGDFSLAKIRGEIPFFIMSYIRYTIVIDEPADAELLIARLIDAGFEGMEEEENEIRAYAEKDNVDENFVRIMLQEQGLKYTRQELGEQNWNQIWETDYHPIIIEDFCMIRAAFHQPLAGVKHDLVITPKMSFGTGHHATTYLMIDAMREINFSGEQVLDFGTGTGILAILSAKMGAGQIVAVDNDDWSIENAKENVIANDCSNITVLKGDSTTELGIFDILLANITKNFLIENLADFRQHLRLGGVLILGGFFDADEEEMLRTAELNKMHKVREYRRDGWACLVLKKKA
ncbi:MAG: 50S ribosomal protein L11 methyltransferase [Bacteroidetes bacterium]|nr:MAG: 50S ribosomal protein L11 methyltransferase [Bacteroidota bacterium]